MGVVVKSASIGATRFDSLTDYGVWRVTSAHQTPTSDDCASKNLEKADM
jgi:hypothetical protein